MLDLDDDDKKVLADWIDDIDIPAAVIVEQLALVGMADRISDDIIGRHRRGRCRCQKLEAVGA